MERQAESALTRREFLEAGVPASLLALAAVHPCLPDDFSHGSTCVSARWVENKKDYISPSWTWAIGQQPCDPALTCLGSIEGILFGDQPRPDQWYLRVGSDMHTFEAPTLDAAKKHAEIYMVEHVRACLVAMERSAFALRAR